MNHEPCLAHMDTPDLFKKLEVGRSIASNSLMSLLGGSSSQNGLGFERKKSAQNGPSDEATVPGDIPKDELMVLCMKLNKKMQYLESKNYDLARTITQLNSDRTFLVDLLASIAHTTLPSHDAVLDRDLVRQTLDTWEESQRSQLSDLESKLSARSKEVFDLVDLAEGDGPSGSESSPGDAQEIKVRPFYYHIHWSFAFTHVATPYIFVLPEPEGDDR
jgi:hypothetical protein